MNRHQDVEKLLKLPHVGTHKQIPRFNLDIKFCPSFLHKQDERTFAHTRVRRI